MHDLIRRMSIPCHPEQPRHQVMERHFCFAKWFKEPTPELRGTWYWSHPQCWESFTSKTPKQLKIPKCPTDYGNGGSIFGGPEKNSMGNWFPLICNFLQGASAAAPKPISLQFDPRSLAAIQKGRALDLGGTSQRFMLRKHLATPNGASKSKGATCHTFTSH